MIEYFSLGGMAQLVEHSLHMRGVTGSSPVVSTKTKAHQSWWAFILVKTTCGQEPENLFSAFGGCKQPLALCTVCIVADTLRRCAVYSFLHYAEQPLLSFVSTTDSNGDNIAFAQCLRNLWPRSHCTRLTFGNNRCWRVLLSPPKYKTRTLYASYILI